MDTNMPAVLLAFLQGLKGDDARAVSVYLDGEPDAVLAMSEQIPETEAYTAEEIAAWTEPGKPVLLA